jgi:hypothetical protein
MKRAALLALAALAACGGQTTNGSDTGQDLEANGGGGAQEPPMAGIHWARGEGGPKATGSPDLIYHGGPVMHGTHVEPIFWGDWSSPGDKISGLQKFYGGLGGSSYGGTNTEYTDSTGNASSATTLGATHMDPSGPPRKAPRTSAILAEVCKTITNPVEGGYYPVYVTTKRGRAGYCAWHSAGTCGSTTVQFAFFFNLDGDPGCDPGDSSSGHSQGLSALANVSGHEWSEMVTDRHLDAWYDAGGAENSDKCAWTFGSKLLSLGGSQWMVQGNWSNNAYDNNRGYTDPTSGFVRGCIDGTNNN